MDIKDKSLYCWNDQLANHIIHEKYLRAKKILEGGEYLSPPYPPCCRLLSGYWNIEQDYSKNVNIRIKSYNYYLKSKSYRI